MSKIEKFFKSWKISSKIQNFVKKSEFRQKLRISSKIENFVKNWEFRQKLQIFPRIENFSQKFIRVLTLIASVLTLSKIENLVKHSKTFTEFIFPQTPNSLPIISTQQTFQ